MIIITKKDGEGETIRMKPDSSAGIYVTTSVEAECHMLFQNQKMQEEEKKRTPKVNALKNLPAIPRARATSQKSLKKQPNYIRT